MKRILIADSDAESRSLIAKYAHFEGYSTSETGDGKTAVSMCRQNPFNIVILDVTISGMEDGLSVLKTIRTFSQIPVLILSAQCSQADRIRGLEAGADDYMAKPFSTRELLLRVGIILRRNASPQTMLSQKLVSDNIHIDITARRVFVDENPISLTPKEFDLLTLLLGHPNVAFSRKRLLDMVWGGELSKDTRTLDTHIKQIRRAISPYSDRIVTLRGVGYRFE